MKIKIKKSIRRLLGRPKAHVSIVEFDGSATIVTGNMSPEQMTDALTVILHSGDEFSQCIKSALMRYTIQKAKAIISTCDCANCVAARKKVAKMKAEN